MWLIWVNLRHSGFVWVNPNWLASAANEWFSEGCFYGFPTGVFFFFFFLLVLNSARINEWLMEREPRGHHVIITKTGLSRFDVFFPLSFSLYSLLGRSRRIIDCFCPFELCKMQLCVPRFDFFPFFACKRPISVLIDAFPCFGSTKDRRLEITSK